VAVAKKTNPWAYDPWYLNISICSKFQNHYKLFGKREREGVKIIF